MLDFLAIQTGLNMESMKRKISNITFFLNFNQIKNPPFKAYNKTKYEHLNSMITWNIFLMLLKSFKSSTKDLFQKAKQTI